jgi:hypothetical protein
MSGSINREIELAHDNDDGSDFVSRHEGRRACSNFAVNFTDKSVQTAKLNGESQRSERAYRPPKSFRNELNNLPGKVAAFCGRPWNC